MGRRQLNPLVDPVFKRIFGEEKEIMMELINAVIGLEHPVVNIDYLPRELLPEGIDDKTTIVDVRCTDNINRHFIVEMQLVQQADLQKRVFFNAARVYGRQIDRGVSYSKLQPVYGCVLLITYWTGKQTAGSRSILSSMKKTLQGELKKWNCISLSYRNAGSELISALMIL